MTTVTAVLLIVAPAFGDSSVSAEERQRLEQREQEIASSIAGQADNPSLYSSRGRVRFELGNVSGAIEDYDRALLLSPTDPLLYHRRCYAKKELHANLAAVQDCEKAVELEPSYQHAWNTLGNLRDDLGDHEGALQAYDRSIAADPLTLPPYTNKIITFTQHHMLSSASKACDEAFTVAAPIVQLRLGPGAPIISQFAHLDVSLPIDQAFDDLYANCAEVRLREERYFEANELAQQAVDLNPANEYAVRKAAKCSAAYTKSLQSSRKQ